MSQETATTMPASPSAATGRGPDRFLLAIIAGALLLILAGAAG
jgi:hypothetical protein